MKIIRGLSRGDEAPPDAHGPLDVRIGNDLSHMGRSLFVPLAQVTAIRRIIKLSPVSARLVCWRGGGRLQVMQSDMAKPEEASGNFQFEGRTNARRLQANVKHTQRRCRKPKPAYKHYLRGLIPALGGRGSASCRAAGTHRVRPGHRWPPSQSHSLHKQWDRVEALHLGR